MTRPPIRGLGRALLILALLLPLLIHAARAAEPKRVLIIHSYGRDFAPYIAIGVTLRTDLTQLLRQSVAFHEASLDAERGGGPEDEQPFVEYLHRRSRDAPPDLVVTIAPPAALFYLRHRDELFPGRPLLVTGVDRRRAEGIKLAANDRLVTVYLDIRAGARTIRDLQPDASTVAIVLGVSPLEQSWTGEVERELAAELGDRVRVLPSGSLTLEQMRRRVATLPPKSAVMYGMFAVGGDGAQYENEQALAAIRESSNSPVYGLFAHQLGKGTVGGSLIDTRQVGSVSAEVALRMLNGEPADGTSIEVPAHGPVFDWKELQRWGIPETRLPAGAEVRFRPPSMWQQHRLLIVTATAIVLLQAALIAALLFQRARRRSAEGEALGLSGRLLTAHEDERRRLARELHDDLTQRLARLAIDAGQLGRGMAVDASEMQKDLVRLSEDVHALSYRLHPSVLDDLGLVEALRAECARVARLGELQVEVDAADVSEAVSSETSLCLYRVAQEALNNATRHGRASAVTVLLSRRDGGLQLVMSDNGRGFDPARPRERASLGLASMRERVRLLRGQLDIESTPGRGTTVVAWVPA